MIRETPIAEIDNLTGAFQNPQTQMVLAAVIAGNNRAQIWRGDSGVLLWDKGNNVFYLSGYQAIQETAEEWAELIEKVIKPQAIGERKIYFKTHLLDGDSQEPLRKLFPGVELKPSMKRFYNCKNLKISPDESNTLPEIQIELIDANFLTKNRLNLSYLKSEIEWMWPSINRFTEKGFGFSAMMNDAIICWCTAEYVSEKSCGLGIETLKLYEKKGIATATAVRMVDYCLRRGITPYWECDQNNPASVRVAEKVGFELLEESMFYAGSLIAPVQ